MTHNEWLAQFRAENPNLENPYDYRDTSYPEWVKAVEAIVPLHLQEAAFAAYATPGLGYDQAYRWEVCNKAAQLLGFHGPDGRYPDVERLFGFPNRPTE